MSLTLTRYQIERVHGVRTVRLARVGRDRGAWVVSVFTLDRSQRERDIAARFAHLGRVTACTRLTAGDPVERKFSVVLIVPARDVRDAIQPTDEVAQ